MAEFMGIFDDEHEGSQETAWHITSDQMAEWAIRQIEDREAERDRLNEVRNQQIQFYKDGIESENFKCETANAFLKMELIEYFQKVPHKETKTQESYKLPSGSLVMKKARLDFEHDDEKLLAYLKQNDPEMVVISEKPMWGEIKKKLAINGNSVVDTETGMIVEGVTVVEKPESFEVK